MQNKKNRLKYHRRNIGENIASIWSLLTFNNRMTFFLKICFIYLPNIFIEVNALTGAGKPLELLAVFQSQRHLSLGAFHLTEKLKKCQDARSLTSDSALSILQSSFRYLKAVWQVLP